MAFHNQNAFLNHCKAKNLEVTIALAAGISIQDASISSIDQYTIIANDVDGRFNQQRDFLDYYQKNKSIVTVVLPLGQQIQGVITASDVFTIIINDSILLFKNNISMINPINTETYLIFKNDIVAVTL